MWAQGGLPITQVRRTVLLAENRDCVFAAASDFLLHRARSPRTPLISSWNRRILFFGQGAPLQAGIGFYFAPYIGGLVCKWERQTGPPLKN